MSSGAGSWGEFSDEFPCADELPSALPCGRSVQRPEQPFNGHQCGQGDPPCCPHGPACHKGWVVEEEEEAASRGSRDPQGAHPLLRQDHRLYLGGELRRYEQRDHQPRQDEASSVSARLLPGGPVAGDIPAASVSLTVPQVQSKPKALPTTKGKKKSTSKSRPSPSSSSSVKLLTTAANLPPHSDNPKQYRYHYAFTSRREEEEERERPYFEVVMDNDDWSSNGSSSSAASYRAVYGGRGRLWRKMKRSKTKLTAERSGSGTELLVFTFFFVVMMLTLSQVLVVHHKYNGHYSSSGSEGGGGGSGSGLAGGRSARLQYQQEVRMVDRSIAALRRRNLPSPKQAAEDLQKDVFEKRIARLILKAEQESADSFHLGAGSDQAPVNVSDQSTRWLPAMPSSRPLSVSSRKSSSVVLGRLPAASSVSLSLSELRPLSTSSIIPSSQSSRTLSSDMVSSSAFDSVNVSRANSSYSLLDGRSLTVKSTAKNSPQQLKTPLIDLILIGKSSSGNLPESVLPGNVSVEGNDTEGGGYDEVDAVRPTMEGSADNLTLRDGGPRTGNFTNIAFPVRLFCKEEPPFLLGNVSGDVNREHKTLTLSQVQAWHKDLAPGGEWQPPGCVARYRLAVVIPYRDRLAHLTVLLAHLLPILKRQQLHFRIFVVEQSGNLTFNKGRIMNAAFKEALKMYDFQCVVFHDVDLIPEDDRNMYSCPVMPRHMSVAVDEMNYTLSYSMLVGGVLNMRVEHFQHVNGYSNMYWGWGAEDDDMAYRILHVGLKIFRPPSKIARYQMIKHVKRKATSWSIRGRLLRTAVKRYHLDGLNSVQYRIKFIHNNDPLYTHLMVDVGKPDMPIDQR